MTSRIHFEIAILGSCILEQSAYPQVMDILKPQNFSPMDLSKNLFFDHQKMYGAIESLYPHKPINLITAAHALPDHASAFAEYISYVSRAACIKHNAFMLLEFNIRDGFIQLLNTTLETLRKPHQYNTFTAAALSEIRDEALNGDIFEIIEKAEEFLLQINANQEARQVKQFAAQIDKRIEQIKEAAKIENLFANLEALIPGGSSANKMAMAKLTELTKQILITNSLEKDRLNKLLAL